ncbi:hypothetical protein [Paraglaciecola polaris]|uniref:hypothetical protein n=1 Tax=Paraglaciecola polaris TaxID=222814 RepID=UPI0030EB82EC|tara:strand:+ start:1056 stop:1469 length:414 start_codon:yes stop_codon:yes gene_type:complete
MGLILGPLLLFWLVMSSYVLSIGHSLLHDAALYPYTLVVVFSAVLSLILYLYLGFNRFTTSHTLSWYDIPLFFTTHKTAILIFLVCILTHWFGAKMLSRYYLKPLPFIIMFTISFGAITGAFASSAFMKKYNIKREH